MLAHTNQQFAVEAPCGLSTGRRGVLDLDALTATDQLPQKHRYLTEPVMLVAVTVSVGFAWILSAVGAKQGVAILVLIFLNLLCLIVGIRGAHPIGLIFALGIWGTQLIGWTSTRPGPLLAVLQLALISVLALTVAVSAKNTYAKPARGRLRNWFPFWIGVLPWVPSVVAAMMTGDALVASGRAAAAVTALLWLRTSMKLQVPRLAWGLLMGMHTILFLPLVCGMIQPLPDYRFVGGGCAQATPNIIGLAAWITAIAWITLPSQRKVSIGRIAGIAFGVVLLFQVDSRSAAAASLTALSLIMGMRWRDDLLSRTNSIRRLLRSVAVSGLILAAGFVFASNFFVRERAVGLGAFSGREAVWATALMEFRTADLLVQILGTSEGGVGASVVHIASSGTASGRSLDNTGLTILRRSGIIGLGFAIIGLAMAVRTLIQAIMQGKAAPAALLAGAIITIPVEDFFLGPMLFSWHCVAASLMSKHSEPAHPIALEDKMRHMPTQRINT